MGSGCCKMDQGVLDQSSAYKPLDYEQGSQTSLQDQGNSEHFLRNRALQKSEQAEEEQDDDEVIPQFTDLHKYSEFVSQGCIVLEKEPEIKESIIQLMKQQFGKFKYYNKQYECKESILCPPFQTPDGCIYIGQWFNKKFHGRGKLITEEKSIYEGYFYNGYKQGYGRMLFSNGDYYQGEWFQDEMEGQGILILRDGIQFQGYFYKSIYIGNQKGSYFEDKQKKESQQQETLTTKRIISENLSQYENSSKIPNSASIFDAGNKKNQSQFKKFQEMQQYQQVSNSVDRSQSKLSIQSQEKEQYNRSQQQIQNINEFGQVQTNNKIKPENKLVNNVINIEQQQKSQINNGSNFNDFSLEKNDGTQNDNSYQKSQLKQENYEDFKNVKKEQMKILNLYDNVNSQKNDSIKMKEQSVMSGANENKQNQQQHMSSMSFTKREEENGTYNLDDNEQQNNSRNSSMISIKYERRKTQCGDRLVNIYEDLDNGLEIGNIEFNEILKQFLDSIKNSKEQSDVNKSMVLISFQQLLSKNMKQKIAYFQELLQLNNFQHDDIHGRVIDQMDYQTFRIYQQKQIYKSLKGQQNQKNKNSYLNQIREKNEQLEKELMKKIMSCGDQIEIYKYIALLGLKQVYEKQGLIVKLIKSQDEKMHDDNDRNFNAVKQHLIQSGFIMQNYYTSNFSKNSEWKYDMAINNKRKFADYFKQILIKKNQELQPKDIVILGLMKGTNISTIIVDFYIKNEVIPIYIGVNNIDGIMEINQCPIIDEITINIDGFFDSQWNIVWDSTTMSNYRGNINGQKQHYYKPQGYYGGALKVINKYPNDGWINNDTNEKTWVVLFHGGKKQSSEELIAEGYKQCGLQQFQGHQCRFGRGLIRQGIYFYDLIQQAEQHAEQFIINDKSVNPKTIKSPINKPSCYIASDPKDVRPYRILIKEVSQNIQEELSVI